MGKVSGKIRQIVQITFNLKRAIAFVWEGSRFWLLFNSFIQLLQGVVPVLLLLLLKMMVDAVTRAANGSGDLKHITFIIIITGVVTLLSQILGTLGSWGNREQGRHVSDFMAGVLLNKAGGLDYQFFENAKSLDALQRAQEQASFRPAQIVNSLSSIIKNMISLLGVIWIIFRFHPLIVLVLFIAALPGLLNKMFFSSREYLNERKCTEKERTSFYYQYLIVDRKHAKEVRLFNLAPLIIERFHYLRKNLRKIRHDLDVRNAVFSTLSNAFMVVLIFSAYAWVARDVITGNVTVGDFVMFYQAFQKGQSYLRSFLSGFAALYSHNLFLHNLYMFLDIEPKVVTPYDYIENPRGFEGEIEFKNVSFSYPGTNRKVLDKLNFHINKGEVVAVVGENGCGKTTLVKLLCRLYDVDEGCISFDGNDIRRMNLSSLYNEVGVIFQDFNQYNLTLKENICFGNIKKESGKTELDHAVTLAGAEDLVESLPDGYDTLLGVLFDKGQELSGGQWQKVAIARAFFKDSSIIILDEPTSALDPKAELEVFSRFKKMLDQRSALLISHRMATVRMADRICVLDKGKIVEQGTHHELMDLKGLYHELFTMQAKNYH